MSIRRATLSDIVAIEELLDQLGYPDTAMFLVPKIKTIMSDTNAGVIVYELNKKVVGLIAINFVTQLAVKGDFARISYFVVNQAYRNTGIGQILESLCTNWAMHRGCDRIELHCSDYRTAAHEFYKRCGYNESSKYFVKKLTFENLH